MDEDMNPEEPEEQEGKSISSDLIRGHINTIILRALYDGDKYGYAIIAEIERKSHGQYTLKQPSLYSALKRLEKDGYVTSYWGGSVGGGRRKYFSLTEQGREIAEQNQAEWEYSRTVIDSLISDKEFDFNNPAPTAVDMRMLRSSTSRVPSRGGEDDDEPDFEPVYDDSEERERLTTEYEERTAELEAARLSLEEEKQRFEESLRAECDAERERLASEHAQKSAELEVARRTLEEEKRRFEEEREVRSNLDAERRKAEYEQKCSEIAADRAALEEERRRFEEETAQREAEERARSEEFSARLAEIEEARAGLEEEKKAFEAKAEAEANAEKERRALEFGRREEELDADRAVLTEERRRFEAEIQARNAAYFTERDWRERELARREEALERRRKELEEQASSVRLAAESERAAESAEHAEEVAAFEARVSEFEAQETARKEEAERDAAERKRILDEEEAERRRILDEEEASRRRALDAEESARKYALDAEESERRRMLDEEETDRRAALDREETDRKQAIEEETERRLASLRSEEDRFEEEAGSRKAELDERQRSLEWTEKRLRTREEELSARETELANDRAKLTEEIRLRDEQIAAERAAHARELEEQRAKIVAEQETAFREREEQLIHQNYIDLVNTPPSAADEPAPLSGAPASPVVSASPRDYRNVVHDIYAGTVTGSEEPGASEGVRPIDGIDFDDLNDRAAREGIRVKTSGSKPAKREESYSVVHKGKALFLSAIVVFCLCVIEGSVVWAVRQQYGLPYFYPYFIWLAGLALLLVTGLAYANRYGEKSIRKRSPRPLINAFVIYALLVIVTSIVALWVKIDFSDPSALAAYIVIPIIFFFGVVVFGICYYFLTRSKKE